MFFAGTLTVQRRSPGSYDLDTGLFVEGTVASIVVQATVQPVRANVLDLPEGERIQDMIKIYSDLKLFASDQITGMPGDLITWQGRTYEVDQIWDYSTQPFLSHFKSQATVVKTGEAE